MKKYSSSSILFISHVSALMPPDTTTASTCLSKKMQGYRGHPYAATLGTEVALLVQCQGFLHLSAVGGTSFYDLQGSAPVFSCQYPSLLLSDLLVIANNKDAVTVTLVLDPIQEFSYSELKAWSDWWRPLSEHFLICLKNVNPNRHHRRQLRLAARQKIEIKREAVAVDFLPHWMLLYDNLKQKTLNQQQSGRFWTSSTIKAQISLAETIIFSAWHGDDLLGADWYIVESDGCVRAHLSAYTAKGYQMAASYPMLDFAIQWFSNQGFDVIDLGGSPSSQNNGSGLSFFKSGWATHKRQRWLMGKILRPTLYNELTAELCGDHSSPAIDFFPAYRRPLLLSGTDLEIHR